MTDNLRPDNPIVFINSAFTAMTGYSAAEAVGRNCRLLQGPGTDPSTLRSIREALAAGQSFRCELLNYRKDGKSFWNDVTIDPIHDAEGNVRGCLRTISV